jgi:hypothetical protein
MTDVPAGLLRSIIWNQGTEIARHLNITTSHPTTKPKGWARLRPASRNLSRVEGLGEALS